MMFNMKEAILLQIKMEKMTIMLMHHQLVLMEQLKSLQVD